MTTHLIVWGAVFAVMIIAELATMQLISIWFAAGAAAAFVTALLGGELWLQMIFFAAFSILLLVFTRPLLKKLTVTEVKPTNTDFDIGRTAVVTEAIDNKLGKGRAELDSVSWRAVSENGASISKDKVVRIVRIEGTKLYVSEVNEENLN